MQIGRSLVATPRRLRLVADARRPARGPQEDQTLLQRLVAGRAVNTQKLAVVR